MTFTCYPNLSK